MIHGTNTTTKGVIKDTKVEVGTLVMVIQEHK